MVYGSRKIVIGYVEIYGGRSEGHYGLLNIETLLLGEGFLVIGRQVATRA